MRYCEAAELSTVAMKSFESFDPSGHYFYVRGNGCKHRAEQAKRQNIVQH